MCGTEQDYSMPVVVATDDDQMRRVCHLAGLLDGNHLDEQLMLVVATERSI